MAKSVPLWLKMATSGFGAQESKSVFVVIWLGNYDC
jgi:hypothetical protein